MTTSLRSLLIALGELDQRLAAFLDRKEPSRRALNDVHTELAALDEALESLVRHKDRIRKAYQKKVRRNERSKTEEGGRSPGRRLTAGMARLLSLRKPASGGTPEDAATGKEPVLPGGRETCGDWDRWWQKTTPVIDALPWFGENVPPLVRPTVKRRRGEHLSKEAQQRVLISWLAGGFTNQIASRAGVSRRSVYSIIKQAVYTRDPRPVFLKWHDLGLVACIFTPHCLEEDRPAAHRVVCLICHRLIANYPQVLAPSSCPVNGVFRPKSPPADTAGDAQAHLMFHFWLKRAEIKFGDQSCWDDIGDRAMERVEQYELVRDEVTAPWGSRAVADPEAWRRWRCRILDGDRVTPPLLSPDTPPVSAAVLSSTGDHLGPSAL